MSKPYSKIELLIAGFLNRYPQSKAKLKDTVSTYQFLHLCQGL